MNDWCPKCGKTVYDETLPHICGYPRNWIEVNNLHIKRGHHKEDPFILQHDKAVKELIELVEAVIDYPEYFVKKQRLDAELARLKAILKK